MARSRVARVAATVALALFAPAAARATDVAVVRVGDGSTALSSAAAPVFIQMVDGGTGNPLGSIALPTAASGSNNPLTLAGTATSEGGLTRSTDGRYLVLAGYAAAPATATVAGSSSATIQRVVGRVERLGTVNTTTLLGTSAYSGVNIRSAVSSDGGEFWTAGGADVYYTALGAGPTAILTNPSNSRRVAIFGSQLYITAASGAFDGVASVGTGLPTTSGQTAAVLSGFPTAAGPSPFDFVALDVSQAVVGIDTIYVADDRAIASGGGIQKWTFDGATWTLAKTFANGLTAGARGLTGELTPAGVRLWATTVETPTRLVSLLDDGVTADPAFTPLATAASNTVFRGVALAPALPTVSFSAASYSGGEGGGPVTVTVHRGGPVADPLDVSYATSDGTAQAGSDYTATSGTLHFSGGATDAAFEIPIIDDAAVEGTESFTVSLSTPSSAALAAPSTATVSIADNDVASSGAGDSANPGAGAAATPAPVVVGITPAAPLFVVLGKPSVKGATARSGLGVKCPPGPDRCAVVATAKAKKLVVAKGMLRVPGGTVAPVTLKLTRAGASKLKRAGKLAVSVTVTAGYLGRTFRKVLTLTWKH